MSNQRLEKQLGFILERRQNKIRTDQVMKRTGHIKETAPVLWERVAEIIGDAAKQGMLKE